MADPGAAVRAVPIPDARAVERALDRLVPRVRERAARAEADRRVPDETVAELAAAGLFGVLTPKTFGGSELGFATLVDVTARLAEVCGSTGWVYGVLAGHSWLLNLFPEQAQRDVYLSERPLMATVFRLGGTVRRVDGGFRLTQGEGRFCSGIDHADWLIVGNAVQGDTGAPEPRFFVLPRTDVTEIVDDWHVSGLRGTGSKTVRIAEAFIPEHRSVTVSAMLDGSSPGAALHRRGLYRMSFREVAPFSIVGVPLGIARGALRVFSAAMRDQVRRFTEQQLAEQSATFLRVAEAAVEVDAARALIDQSARRIDEIDAPATLGDADRARFARDWAYAAQVSRYAVTRLFEAAGGSGLYDSSELQRSWRDVNAAAQHYAFTWDGAMTAYGRATLEVAPARYGAKGRAD